MNAFLVDMECPLWTLYQDRLVQTCRVADLTMDHKILTSAGTFVPWSEKRRMKQTSSEGIEWTMVQLHRRSPPLWIPSPKVLHDKKWPPDYTPQPLYYLYDEYLWYGKVFALAVLHLSNKIPEKTTYAVCHRKGLSLHLSIPLSQENLRLLSLFHDAATFFMADDVGSRGLNIKTSNSLWMSIFESTSSLTSMFWTWFLLSPPPCEEIIRNFFEGFESVLQSVYFPQRFLTRWKLSWLLDIAHDFADSVDFFQSLLLFRSWTTLPLWKPSHDPVHRVLTCIHLPTLWDNVNLIPAYPLKKTSPEVCTTTLALLLLQGVPTISELVTPYPSLRVPCFKNFPVTRIFEPQSKVWKPLDQKDDTNFWRPLLSNPMSFTEQESLGQEFSLKQLFFCHVGQQIGATDLSWEDENVFDPFQHDEKTTCVVGSTRILSKKHGYVAIASFLCSPTCFSRCKSCSSVTEKDQWRTSMIEKYYKKEDDYVCYAAGKMVTNALIWNGAEYSPVNIFPTGKKQEVWEAVFSNKARLTCTPDHIFFIVDSNGSIKKSALRSLSVGDQLAPFRLPYSQDSLLYSEMWNHNLDDNLSWLITRARLWYGNDKGTLMLPTVLDDLLRVYPDFPVFVYNIMEQSSAFDFYLLLQSIGIASFFHQDSILVFVLPQNLRQRFWKHSLRNKDDCSMTDDVLAQFQNAILGLPIVLESVNRNVPPQDIFCFTDLLRGQGMFEGILTGQCDNRIILE